MPLSQNESLLLEAVKSMLSGKAKLGLAVHEKSEAVKDDASSLQFLHENIEQQFHLDTYELPQRDSICAAFHKVHSYKYITDPKFTEDLIREFKAMAVPGEQQEKALDVVTKILKEMKSNNGWVEKDAGWHPQLDEILEASRPEQPQM